MKDFKEKITTLLISFMALKLVDFYNLSRLDIIILALLGINIVISILIGRKRSIMNLKEIRLSKGLSVPALSRISGIPLRTIENIERNNECMVSTAKKLSKTLKVTLDELCEDQTTY